MKKLNFIIVAIIGLSLSLGLTSCSKEDPGPVSANKLRITVGSSVFTATLYDNATTEAFIAMLPLTLNMRDLNSNEKFYDLSNSLPSNHSRVGSIRNGDIMLYSSRTLVLFYESFSSSYSYTRIGSVDNTSGWKSALGSGNVTVTFELQ
ncbi:MAG: cyclophilin-like fold protein [Petrimonas sp.]|nr:cyclophilin-like fold protein [Petrimonas sp.]